jgi:hypothetical protein
MMQRMAVVLGALLTSVAVASAVQGDAQKQAILFKKSIYAVTHSGELLQYRHTFYEDGTSEWEGGNVVGTDWDQFPHVFDRANNDYIVAVTKDGGLMQYWHSGRKEGVNRWGGAPPRTSSGWGRFTHVLTAGWPTIYGVTGDGELWWFGYHSWIGQSPGKRVGTDWNQFKHVFAVGFSIYGVKNNGELWCYRHAGYTDGSAKWLEPTLVGTDWNQFKHVFPGAGVIYAIANDGKLHLYQHRGAANGTADWRYGTVVGTDWHRFKHVFAARG